VIRVTVWNEFIHERENPAIRAVYPDGIHGCIGSFLKKEADMSVRLSSLDLADQGLGRELLAETDVLIYWAHLRHDLISSETVERVRERVHSGMGLIALHSAHHSKIMQSLLGTSLNLKWRDGDRERLWCVNPSHPITEGVPEKIELPQEEMYGERFDIPEPDELVYVGWFSGGEVFRSGCTFRRGNGKIFYFQPGHEEYPTYHNPDIQRIIVNAARWARPVNPLPAPAPCVNAKASPEAERGLKQDAQ
jgi:trehalose utilization protein